MRKISVSKADGTRQDFDEQKVRESLKRSGADHQTTNKVMAQLVGKLHDGITTSEIYRQVYELLAIHQAPSSYRYTLKHSLLELGPSGYPFEDFIARVFTAMGYQTKTRVIAQGECIQHELDVVAVKGTQRLMIECKFHNKLGIKTRSRDSLYIQARFEDVRKDFDQPWLVTNTRLTEDAIAYGKCKGMGLLAWNYPQEDSLEKLIDKYDLHPLTCFTFLSPHQKQVLFQNDYVLCSDVSKAGDKDLNRLGLNSDTIAKIKSSLANH